MIFIKNGFWTKLFVVAVFLGFALIAPLLVAAQTDSTTFPVNEAGIAAYAKLNLSGFADFNKVREVVFDSIESASSTYTIGTKKYPVDDRGVDLVNLHTYLGADGWLVVYLLKDEESARIVNWRSDAPLSETMLKYAIDQAVANSGIQLSTGLQYYDFYQPLVKKMTLAKESIAAASGKLTNDFAAYVPGDLHEASWALKSDNGVSGTTAHITIDDNFVGGIQGGGYNYGSYASTMFESRKSYTISLHRRDDTNQASAVTLLLYSVD